jgi:hypothetical protein
MGTPAWGVSVQHERLNGALLETSPAVLGRVLRTPTAGSSSVRPIKNKLDENLESRRRAYLVVFPRTCQADFDKARRDGRPPGGTLDMPKMAGVEFAA